MILSQASVPFEYARIVYSVLSRAFPIRTGVLRFIRPLHEPPVLMPTKLRFPDSNRGLSAYQTDALTTELNPTRVGEDRPYTSVRWPSNASSCKHEMHLTTYRSKRKPPMVFISIDGLRNCLLLFSCSLIPGYIAIVYGFFAL